MSAFIDVSVGPENIEKFSRELDFRQIDYSVVINDLQQAIYDERTNTSEVDGVQQDSHFLRFDRYNNLDQIEDYLFRVFNSCLHVHIHV